jgi:hypothetical protein
MAVVQTYHRHSAMVDGVMVSHEVLCNKEVSK